VTQTIILNLPDKLYEPIQRTAQATNRSVETVLLTALQTSLPSLEGLPEELVQELAELETLDNDRLREILLEMVPVDQQQQLEALLQQNQAGELTEVGQETLNFLQTEADKVMLRKARAAVLLRFRGQRVPTLTELRELTISAT
jgi:hypothetical protein